MKCQCGFWASTAVATSCLLFNASNSLCSNSDALNNKQLVATAVEADFWSK